MSLLPTTVPKEQRAAPPPVAKRSDELHMPNTAPSVSTGDMLAQNVQTPVDGIGHSSLVKPVEDPYVAFSAALVRIDSSINHRGIFSTVALCLRTNTALHLPHLTSPLPSRRSRLGEQ